MKILKSPYTIIILSFALGLSVTLYGLSMDILLAYGDAESHLNIAKRVVDSLTPGLAQLGGIWLPLPHLLMVPFVKINALWNSGLAGAFISGAAFVMTSVYLYLLTHTLTRNYGAAFLAFLVFALNPNILYLQSTAMTELPLLAFFTASLYHLVKYFQKEDSSQLILSAFFGFAATLTRYDGWMLVLVEAGLIFIWHLLKVRKRTQFSEVEAKVILFVTLAFVGIAGWILWDLLILNDPFYFTNSPFSAKSQQQNWLARGELPAYKNLGMSVMYYLVTAAVNIGWVMVILALIGLLFFIVYKPSRIKWLTAIVFLIPLAFNIATLYIGQSIIFIPQLTPETYEWRLFNVRYGVMMIPAAAFFIAFLYHVSSQIHFRNRWFKPAIAALFLGLLSLQTYRFVRGVEPVISFDDGVYGLSAAKRTDAQNWLKKNYDKGYILVDDFARTTSIIRSKLPMDKVIYVGTKPYWEESLKEPHKYANWIIMQDGDTVWKTLYEDPTMQALLYAHFQKAYTSPQILIFRRSEPLASH